MTKFSVTELAVSGLMACRTCGAMVRTSQTGQHSEFHTDIDAAMSAQQLVIKDLNKRIDKMAAELAQFRAKVAAASKPLEPTVPEAPQPGPEPDTLLLLPEVADLMRTPEATLRYLRNQGQTPYLFKSGKRIVAWKSEVLAHLENERAADATEPAETQKTLPTWEEMSDPDKGAALRHVWKIDWEGRDYARDEYPARYKDHPALTALSPEDASTHAEEVTGGHEAVQNHLGEAEWNRLYNLG